MWALNTCGEPNEIELTAAHRLFYRPLLKVAAAGARTGKRGLAALSFTRGQGRPRAREAKSSSRNPRWMLVLTVKQRHPVSVFPPPVRPSLSRSTSLSVTLSLSLSPSLSPSPSPSLPPLSLSLSGSHTHAHTHARTHAHEYEYEHTRTCTHAHAPVVLGLFVLSDAPANAMDAKVKSNEPSKRAVLVFTITIYQCDVSTS